MTTLDEALNGESVTEEPEKGAEVESEAAEVEAKEVETKEVEDETPDEKEASPAPESETTVPLSAVTGERKRRQEAEKELQALREKVESNKPATSVFEDETKFRTELETKFQNQMTSQMLDFSERMTRKLRGDEIVDNAITWFKDAAVTSPLLAQQFNDSGNDVDEIVTMYNSHLEMEKMKDVDAYKAELEAKVRAEVEEKLKGEIKAKEDLRSSIPDSLVGDSSKGGLTGNSYGGPTPIEDVVG